MDLSVAKDIAIVLGTIVALVTFFSGTWEYVRQGHQHRAQHFVQMRRRFLETPQYREILDLLATNDPALATISVQEKRNFVGFLEEVALMVNSGLIRRDVAHYMFGYYVLLCQRSESFWQGLDRTSQYWSLFRQFASEMERMGNKVLPSRQPLRF
ncbi:MAG: hypothetical protein HONBIEJF_01451 [Fimbriimonadaceae bacterium]|nr:hypothetical protein [Fimbriimonadaceae bacterium]